MRLLLSVALGSQLLSVLSHTSAQLSLFWPPFFLLWLSSHNSQFLLAVMQILILHGLVFQLLLLTSLLFWLLSVNGGFLACPPVHR